MMGAWVTTFEWDAENRLTAAYPVSPHTGDQKIEFKYDYLGRRVEKAVYDWASGDWSETPSEVRRFVWAGPALDTAGASADRFAVPGLRPDGGVKGALMLMELDGDNSPVRKYTWGLDLAGQSGMQSSALPEALEAAGGIGGLLAVEQVEVGGGTGQGGVDAGNYVFAYDGNGNVVQVLDWAAASAPAAIVAKYEYDPYGNVVASGGDYAAVNPFRFSTKYWDDETGLGYWGYRYYSSRMGRWVSQDPIGNGAEHALYLYGLNRPSAAVDALGLCTIGDACYDVELGVMPGFQLDPSKETKAVMLIVLATVETAQIVARVQGAAESYLASECVPSLNPGMFKLSVSVGGLLLKLKQAQVISIWTRHRCSICSQGFWNGIFSGLGLCKPKGSWHQDDWTSWNKCKELVHGWMPPDAAVRGLSPQELDAYANRCVAAEASRAGSDCGADRPCGAPPECEKCDSVRFEYDPY
jgi:RHS repeat-associated protein